MTRQDIVKDLTDLQSKLTIDNSIEFRDIKSLIALLILTVQQEQEKLLRAAILDQYSRLLNQGSSQN